MVNSINRIICFLKDYFNINSRLYFILLNDSGVFLFSLSRTSQSIILYSLLKDFHNIDDCLDDFIIKYNKESYRFYSPPICLIGGSKSFFYIQSMDINKLNRQIELPGQDYLGNTTIKFKYLTFKSKRVVYYAGLNRQFAELITSRFANGHVLISKFQPVTHFLLESIAETGFDKPAVFELPGMTVWFSERKEILFYEQCYNDLQKNIIGDGPFGENDRAEIYSIFIGSHTPSENKKTLFELVCFRKVITKQTGGFFKLLKNEQSTNLFYSITNGLRFASMLTMVFAVILLLFAGGYNMVESGYDDLLASYQRTIFEKQSIESEVANLSIQLEEINYSDYNKSSFAGAISSFCQKRPYDLYLKELNLFRDNDEGWILSAAGVSQQEASVFNYRDYIVNYTNDMPVEVTLLQEDGTHYGNQNREHGQRYGFSIRMQLGK